MIAKQNISAQLSPSKPAAQIEINKKSNSMSAPSFEVYVLAHLNRRNLTPSIRHPGKFSRQF